MSKTQNSFADHFFCSGCPIHHPSVFALLTLDMLKKKKLSTCKEKKNNFKTSTPNKKLFQNKDNKEKQAI